MVIQPPKSKHELLERARLLSGCTLQQLATEHGVVVPSQSLNAKGWLGNLLETVLGATASTSPEPDFMELGIELKSIPVNIHGKPRESTYVCLVQLDPAALANWESSLVKKKLNHVLWIPYESDNSIPLKARRIGAPVLWQPDAKQEEQLRSDWQELSDMIVLGQLDSITSTMGTYLQIRPKAANARVQTRDRNQPDKNAVTLPRGYYLRTALTRQILSRAI